jgi:hypothetical protein
MLQHVQQGTQRLVRQLGLSDNLAMLDRAWQAELGGLSKLARIVALDRSALVVEADSAPAMHEISLRRMELVRRLNKHFPETFISQITVRVAQH